jgi:hypothetical protein
MEYIDGKGTAIEVVAVIGVGIVLQHGVNATIIVVEQDLRERPFGWE